MPATLVVVDMQQYFDAACDPNVVINVTEEIIKAKHRNGHILLVEYAGCGKSHDGFSQLLKNYRYKARIRKGDDDGSAEIIRALRRRGFNDRHLRLCGVNADCCVCATAKGLLSKLDNTKIEVVKRACGTVNDFDWRMYIRHPNLRLV